LIDGDRTLLDALTSGADTATCVDQLVSVLREDDQRSQLAARLAGRRPGRGAADVDTLG